MSSWVLNRLRHPNGSPPPSSLTGSWNVLSTGPILMGTPVPSGWLPAGQGIQVGSFTTQTTVLNTWADGSARHIAVSYNATSTGVKALTAITNQGGTYTPTWPSASVAFVVTAGPGSGSTYTATLPAFSGTNTVSNGAVCRRSYVLVTPTTSGAVAHANLQVIFEITSYAVGGHQVSITIQNIRHVSTMDQVTADVTTTVNASGFAALTKTGWTIYTGQRWHRTAYVSLTEAVVLGDYELWILANVIPRISPTVDAKTYDLTTAAYGLGGGGSGFYFGEAISNQLDSENVDRQELNPWCDWEARLFALNTEAYRLACIANSNQSGGWCWQIDKAGDGRAILKLTEDSNYASIQTDRAQGVNGNDGLTWPSYFDVGGTAAWRGAFDVTNSTPGNTQVNTEHLSEMSFVAYLLTCDTFHLDQLRFQGSWAALGSLIGYSEADSYVWSGYSRGRHGVLGELNDAEMGRGFGRPLKKVARAAWAIPDSNSADQTYFKTLVSNNLDAVARYIDYIDSKGWGGTWMTYVGVNPGRTDGVWANVRSNTVSSTTGANPTVLTVVGDNSGTGTGTNDHGMQTGDFVDLAGFSGGAAGLNGHRAITRLTATTFSVAVNTTGSATSGVGTWSTHTSIYNALWRTSDAAREVSWIGFTGLWTITASMWAFPDRLVKTQIAMQDYPNYTTTPGVAANFYPVPCHVVADNLVFYENWTDFEAANNVTAASAPLLNSQSVYTSFASTSHRGNPRGWNPTNADTFYTTYATVDLLHGRRRGLTGAATAYTTLTGIATVLAELKRRPGFFHTVP